MGRIYTESGRSDLALSPLQKATTAFEGLGDKGRGSLSAALGDLANAYSHLGQHELALMAAERGMAIDRDLGNESSLAAGFVQIAQILLGQQRYAEAESLFKPALAIKEKALGPDPQ